jgi:hypothetical protein
VHDDTESFIRANHGRDTNEPLNTSEYSPPTAGSRESEKNSNGEAEEDVGYTHSADEEHARFVAIADGPTDKVRV